MAVFKAQVLVNPNGPGTASVVVTSMVNDCEQISAIRQYRMGSTAHVDVLMETKVPPACPQTARFITIQKIIPLDGSFEPGPYQAIVNGVPLSFDVPAE